MDWWFHERDHAGDEHLEPAEAARFDTKLPFDPADDIQLLREYGLSEDDLVVDFGTGTGTFPLAVADHCDRVIAIDVADAMLAVAEEKLEATDVTCVELVNEGFLSYEHRAEPAAVVFSKDALHHLPDFWKVEALKTVRQILEPGGIFRLRDFVFSFAPADSESAIEAWIDEQRETPFTDEEIAVHFREEFSTYGFLLESMLERVGFEILEATYDGAFYGSYTCRRV